MTTFQQIYADAFGALALANYEFDVTPEMRADADRKLDQMMAVWEHEGIDLGYTPSPNPPVEGVMLTTPAWADEAIYSNLAIRLAPTFGKVPSPELRRMATRGYARVSATATVPAMTGASFPLRGAGNRRWLRNIDTLT